MRIIVSQGVGGWEEEEQAGVEGAPQGLKRCRPGTLSEDSPSCPGRKVPMCLQGRDLRQVWSGHGLRWHSQRRQRYNLNPGFIQSLTLVAPTLLGQMPNKGLGIRSEKQVERMAQLQGRWGGGEVPEGGAEGSLLPKAAPSVPIWPEAALTGSGGCALA